MGERFVVCVLLGVLFVCFTHANRQVEDSPYQGIFEQNDISIEDSSEEPDLSLVVQDCVLSAWSEWSPCSKPCAGGIKTKTRSVLVEPRNGGRRCGRLTWTNWCNSHPCPIDCTFTAWSGWGPACQPCTGQSRWRNIQPAKYGGKACPNEPLIEFRLCSVTNCNECVYGPPQRIPNSQFLSKSGERLERYEAPLLYTPPHLANCPPHVLSTRHAAGKTNHHDNIYVQAFQSKMPLPQAPEPPLFEETVF
eukprot:TRINITY_DN1847_c0_g1_i1.p1 TRINITY_DN1847_c0_g1~~TRINITY_DN1847_c0_g1_i1.p1  ORF type:complete len:249 (+),score=3.95 TRINITY_DN1847_c0_g1_i1:88-834(+)